MRVAAAQGLIIPSGGYMIANNGNIVLTANWTNNGSFTHNGGTLIFAGAVQTLGGTSSTQFNNLTIMPGSKTSIISSGQKVIGAVQSNDTLNANGNLTLLSTAVQTAEVDGSGAGQITGNVTVQRYVPSGFGYKYISSPFISDSVGEYASVVNLTSAFPSFYSNNESLTTAGWVNYTNPSGQLIPLTGYAANLGASATPVTIAVTGVLNNGSVSSPLLYNHNMTYTEGFNLAGNPYPSPINWNSSTGWTMTNIDNAIYYFNAGTTNQYTGVYSSYINGVSSDGVAGSTIPAMQGFFVHVTNGTFPVTGQLTVNNNARVLNPTIILYGGPSEPQIPIPQLRLTAGFADVTRAADPVVCYFPGAATGLFNKTQDALKLMNTDPAVPNLYAVSTDSKTLSIVALPPFSDSLTVPLGLTTPEAGWVTFNAGDVSQIPVGWHVYLYDLTTGVIQDMGAEPLYRLNLAMGDYAGRFFLKFSTTALATSNPPPVIPNPAAVDNFWVYSSPGELLVHIDLASSQNGRLMVIDMRGQVVYQRDIGGNGLQQIDANFAPGVYLVRLYTSKETHVKKVFIGPL